MIRDGAIAAAAALALIAPPAGAAPGDKMYAHPGGGPALVVPAASPVRFKGFDKDGAANFSGRFTLTGTFVYGCQVDCEPPTVADNLEFEVLPDPELAKRLPHWHGKGDGMVIDISGAGKLTRTLANQRQLAALLSGKIPDIRGRISIVVDSFAADFGCDYSPYYGARFISVAKPPEIAKLEINGDFGCA
jgi:hypothetical protein